MFKSTRVRLTVSYTIIMSAFLMFFIMVTSFVLSSIMEQDQKNELKNLVTKEIEVHTSDLKEWYQNERVDPIDIGYHPHRTMFYYVVGYDNSIIHGNETRPELRESILGLISETPTDGSHIVDYEIRTEAEVLTIALLGKDVHVDNEWIGTVYAGTDITKQRELYRTLLFILSILAIIFITGSTMIAYYMAGKAMKPIEKAFIQKKNFVADASHELRTPLSVLHSSVQVIDFHDKERLSSFSKQTLDDMKSEIKRMTSLVEDLLKLARLDNDQIKKNKEKFSLSEEAKVVLRQFDTVANKKDITVTHNIEPSLEIYGDREQLVCLIYILIDNAIKFTPKKGEVDLSLKLVKNKIILEVSDTGIGISKDEQEKIFERFYRVDQGRNRDEGGTGLGLSIAWEIIKSHNGVITVFSDGNQGSTFQVELPCNL